MSSFEQWETEGETLLEEEWIIANRTSPRDRNQPRNGKPHSDVTLLERDWLTSEVIDSQIDQQQDWIGQLQPDWMLELYNLNLLGIKDENDSLKHSSLSVKELVFLIREAQYQPLTIFHQQHWGYSCCLQIASLGRVRLVVCFNNPKCFGRHAAFVTNRLDWSPRHIISQWLKHRVDTNLYSKTSSPTFLVEDSLQLA